MYVENANQSAQICVITPENIEPNPKNPIIASFFRNIGYAEQLGSGVRNLFKYSKFYSGKEPEFIEDDIFRIIVPLQDNNLDSSAYSTTQSAGKPTQSAGKPTQSAGKPTQSAGKPTQSAGKPTQSAGKPTQSAGKPTQSAEKPTQSAEKPTQSPTQLRIIKAGQDITELMRQEPELSQKQIAEQLNLNVNTVKYYIKKMQKQGKISRIGSSRKGKWVIKD